ncbi:hypothetical protein HZS61_006435 [Fusarium oxysporum f. sp. conglutinans]|uniref:Uncharacterized protein n=1 Tax=Fusarium oxysporum f. sp. conglutinans TaxID=100902 RepID=A0A8H6G9J9_FUSOX|nr:hypothetical protein HZS61_006435 [Fusarium oxysporum f. sp. conglutinans]
MTAEPTTFPISVPAAIEQPQEGPQRCPTWRRPTFESRSSAAGLMESDSQSCRRITIGSGSAGGYRHVKVKEITAIHVR